ncbi:hypothetical protein BH20CHL7_BH20CHL7_11870 [soil metagenome]
MAAKSVIEATTGEDVIYLTLFAVLPVAALYGGIWAGVTVSIVGAIVDNLIFYEPVGSLAIDDSADVVPFLLFVPVSLWVAWLVGSLARLRGEASREANRFRGLIAALPDFAILADRATGRIDYANAAVEGLGWHADTIIGRDIEDIIPGIRRDVLRQGSGGTATLALVAADGSETMVEVHHRELTTTGGPGILVSARDVTERIESEIRLVRLAAEERQSVQTLQTLLGSMDAGVAVLGPDGEVTMANDAMTRLTGGPVASRTAMAESLRADIVSGEVWLPESRRWLDLWLHEEEGSGLVVIRDVTAQREALAAQDAFMGVLSHELRTPVTTILGLAHLISRPRRSDGPDGPPLEELAGDILAEAERLNSLIEDLLVLSRAQTGQVAYDPEPVLVQHIVSEGVRAEARRYPHVTFRTDLERDLPPVDGDRTLLSQVLRNLVGNAGKYSPATPCEVAVIARRAGDSIEVVVLDQGPGFNEEDSERLFDIFFRSGRTAKVRSGSGVGLYVARTLIEAMHGRIWARLRERGGSEFGFSLPILTEDEGVVPASDTTR